MAATREITVKFIEDPLLVLLRTPRRKNHNSWRAVQYEVKNEVIQMSTHQFTF